MELFATNQSDIPFFGFFLKDNNYIGSTDLDSQNISEDVLNTAVPVEIQTKEGRAIVLPIKSSPINEKKGTIIFDLSSKLKFEKSLFFFFTRRSKRTCHLY